MRGVTKAAARSMALLLFSVQHRSLPWPFIHELHRSTTHHLPAWIGAGTPSRAISPLKPKSSSKARGLALS